MFLTPSMNNNKKVTTWNIGTHDQKELLYFIPNDGLKIKNATKLVYLHCVTSRDVAQPFLAATSHIARTKTQMIMIMIITNNYNNPPNDFKDHLQVWHDSVEARFAELEKEKPYPSICACKEEYKDDTGSLWRRGIPFNSVFHSSIKYKGRSSILSERYLLSILELLL